MGFGKLLEEKMKAKNVKQAELAEAVGLPKTTLSSMILRDNTKIEIEKFLKICKYLDCNPEDFYSEFKTQNKKMPPLFTAKYYRLDPHGKEMVDTVLEMEYTRCTATEQDEDEEQHITLRLSYLAASAGTGDYLDSEDYEHITVKRTETTLQADFAVRVNGDSMEPTYHDGEILLVEGTPYINVGDIGVFVVNGNGYVKEYGGDRLISHNEDFEDIMLHDYDVVICSGRVIGVLEE
ncbi:MAG: LexA family transcriptional regulator [Oscillospiraceae bacterium]|nr:LexA family transcriptional regulator [Oscillospiraceae bacterium]